MLRAFLFFFFVSLSACSYPSSIKSRIDLFSFNIAGGTVFEGPAKVSTKDIHFEIYRLVGKDIIIEGNIEDIGDYATHVVVSDSFGRVLVVLTNIVNTGKLLTDSSVGRLRIWGTVKRGKKGLPFVQARAIRNAVDDSKKS